MYILPQYREDFKLGREYIRLYKKQVRLHTAMQQQTSYTPSIALKKQQEAVNRE